MKDSKIATLEAQRVSLIYKLEKLSIDELLYSPGQGKWSIIQIIEHLVLIEENSVQYVSKKIQAPERLKPIGLKSHLLGFLMNLYLNLNLKAKAPEIVNPLNREADDFQNLISRWVNARKKLEELSKVSPSVLEKGVFKHAAVGYMNYNQMLNFFSHHYAHHLGQINSIVEMFDKELSPAL